MISNSFIADLRSTTYKPFYNPTFSYHMYVSVSVDVVLSLFLNVIFVVYRPRFLRLADTLGSWASIMVQLDLNFKKLACALQAALHEPKKFVVCLRALGKVMTSPPLVASKHTCYKLVTSLSTRARNVIALDTCHTRNQLEHVFPL